jgi:hypothetical protein
VIAGVVALLLAFPAAAVADPGSPNPQQSIALTCSDRTHPTVNTGTPTNRGRVAWVTTTTGVNVTAYLAFTDGTDTLVLFDSKQGAQAHQTLVTCTGDAGGGFTVIAIGFSPHINKGRAADVVIPAPAGFPTLQRRATAVWMRSHLRTSCQAAMRAQLARSERHDRSAASAPHQAQAFGVRIPARLS